jgi:tryptophan-rich sensory protein
MDEIRFWYIVYFVVAMLTLYLFLVGIYSEWFKSLVIPSWQPSLAAIIVIWIVVYGLSYWGIWKLYKKEVINHSDYLQPSSISHLFALSLIFLLLFTFWTLSILYQSLYASLAILIGIFIFGLYYLYFVYQIDHTAGLFQIPFILWLLFYVFLGAQYLILNPTQ